MLCPDCGQWLLGFLVAATVVVGVVTILATRRR